MNRAKKLFQVALFALAGVAGALCACDRGQRGLPEDSAASEQESAATGRTESELDAGTPRARPAVASPTGASEGRPPHPAIPPPIEEPSPSANMFASTPYRWLPGHWIWTGQEYVWQSGVWVYELQGYALLPPRWLWDAEQWTFQDAGWARRGTRPILYRPTALPDGSASMGPSPDPNEAQVALEVSPTTHTVYDWTGTWVAPPIVYPSATASGEAAARYERRLKASNPSFAVEPAPRAEISVRVQAPVDEEINEPVEYIPGVLHGGKRGEEELRLMQEAQEREAAENAAAEDAAVVPYWGYPIYYEPVRPVRPRPPRPVPLPGQRPVNRSPSSRPR